MRILCSGIRDASRSPPVAASVAELDIEEDGANAVGNGVRHAGLEPELLRFGRREVELVVVVVELLEVEREAEEAAVLVADAERVALEVERVLVDLRVRHEP